MNIPKIMAALDRRCKAFSPMGAQCEKDAGHDGQHEGESASSIIAGMAYRQLWDDGYKPGPGAVMMPAGSGLQTAETMKQLRDAPQ